MTGVTYEAVSRIAQQGGSLYFMAIFLVAVVYAFWPRNAPEFKRAAEAALAQDDVDDRPL